MESLTPLLILQIPVVALLLFTGALLAGMSREKRRLTAAIDDLENRTNESPAGSDDKAFAKLAAELDELRQRVDAGPAGSGSPSEDPEKFREYMANQKTALKEFGRVLSRSSEQTYSELQALDERLATIERSLKDNGFDLGQVDEAA